MAVTARQLFDRLDKNRDGKLDRDEVKKLVVGAGVGDGEFFAGTKVERTVDALMQHFGASPNGRVGWDQFKKAAGTLVPLPGNAARDPAAMKKAVDDLYKKADVDHDGKLSQDELAAYAQRNSEAAGEDNADFRGRAAAKLALATLDENGDHKLSKDELLGFLDDAAKPTPTT